MLRSIQKSFDDFDQSATYGEWIRSTMTFDMDELVKQIPPQLVEMGKKLFPPELVDLCRKTVSEYPTKRPESEDDLEFLDNVPSLIALVGSILWEI